MDEYIKRSEVVGLIEDKLKRCETVHEALAFASLRTAVMGLRSASVAPRAEWISVEERLPDQYEDVLGFCHYVYESGGVFDLILTMKLTTDGKFVPFNCSPLKEGIVTHWMPLPEPPKGG